MEYMILPFKRYFEFSGRSRRKEFWMFALLNILVTSAVYVLLFASGGAGTVFNETDPGSGAAFGWLMGGFGLLLLGWGLITLIPSIAVSVRRLHDRDMSGWWYLGVIVGSLIPLLNFIIVIGFIVLMALPGTPGPNRFGPDPKDPTSASVFE